LSSAPRAHGCPPFTVPWPGEDCQVAAGATAQSTVWLRKNLFPFDAESTATYFDGGIVEPTVNLSLTARQRFGWAAGVPRDVFQDAVLPFASVDEARTNWRALLWEALVPTVSSLANTSTLAEVALHVNQEMWSVLGNLAGHSAAIVFKSSQTPLIYDPMSTLLFGYASCTGISLLFVDALRTVGVPARLVGTPAWHGKVTDGNHNWVEIYVGSSSSNASSNASSDASSNATSNASREGGEGEWQFIEGQPAGGGETLSNPCDKWFCNAAHFGSTGTQVFAARYERGDTHYPMAWNLANTGVSGVDRSAWYTQACTACG